MDKSKIYFKLEHIIDIKIPNDYHIDLGFYDPMAIIITGWRTDKPDVMVDSQLTILFPEINEIIGKLGTAQEEPCEGILLIDFKPEDYNLELIHGAFIAAGFDVRRKMVVNSQPHSSLERDLMGILRGFDGEHLEYSVKSVVAYINKNYNLKE